MGSGELGVDIRLTGTQVTDNGTVEGLEIVENFDVTKTIRVDVIGDTIGCSTLGQCKNTHP